MENEKTNVKMIFVNLISPKFIVRYQAPLAVNILAGYVKNKMPEIDVKVIDMQKKFEDTDKKLTINERFENTIESIKQQIINESKKSKLVVGFSMKWTTQDVAKIIVDKIKESNYADNSLFVLGNIGATYAYKELLNTPTFSDALAVVGEGEDALIKIIKVVLKNVKLHDMKNYNGISNVALNLENQIILNKPKRINLKLYPKHTITDSSQVYDKEWDVYAIETSRGCPWGNCTFCSIKEQFDEKQAKKDNNWKWQPFSLDIVFDNIRRLAKQGAISFDIKDSEFFGPVRKSLEYDPFNDTMDRAEMFAKKLIALNEDFNGEIYINHISVRVDTIYREGEDEKNKRRKEVYTLLKEAGVKGVYLGIESGNESQLRRYCKGVTVKENKEAINFMKKLGFEIEVGFIFFDCLATMEELKENLKFIEETKLYETDSRILGTLRLQQGSPYIQLAKNNGLLGEKKKNFLSYISKFKHKDVELIEDIFYKWERVTIKLTKLLTKNLRLEIYKMNLDFLKDIINSPSYIEDTIKIYVNKRKEFLEQINERINDKPNMFKEYIENSKKANILLLGSKEKNEFRTSNIFFSSIHDDIQIEAVSTIL